MVRVLGDIELGAVDAGLGVDREDAVVGHPAREDAEVAPVSDTRGAEAGDAGDRVAAADGVDGAAGVSVEEAPGDGDAFEDREAAVGAAGGAAPVWSTVPIMRTSWAGRSPRMVPLLMKVPLRRPLPETVWSGPKVPVTPRAVVTRASL
jgi:hypothetical protein